MDSSNSQIFGGSQEECHSSESGWTMYIGSPIDDDDNDEVENDVEDQYYKGGGGGDVESDDSMVSDASSAMAANMHNTYMHQKQVKEDEKKNSRKGKKVEKDGNEGKKKEKESTNMNVAPAQSGNKVRRNWLGKKK
ncbi:Suppressor of phytochrome b 5 [Heracleum sosnowskyi]|uniref:Suppressor of phytochrome b 5 n=1 Tax=Heracleum sosnowskyi TaxID=360622 RepID=A0AAD8ILR0_9APIA|nr:Suppressor of phytochrome b 5 [Heracleum sosnowskyi]